MGREHECVSISRVQSGPFTDMVLQHLVLINNLEVEKTEAEFAEFKVQNTVLIDLNIQREECDIMNAQEEEEREVQERLEWPKDMRLEEELEWQEKQIRIDPLALPFPTTIRAGHRGSHSSFALRKPRKD